MCRWLNIPRSSYYYQAVDPVSEADLEDKITYIFLESKSRYGARKIKKCLEKDGIILSRRRIRRIMKRLNLVSVYQKAAFKPPRQAIRPRKTTGSPGDRLDLRPCG